MTKKEARDSARSSLIHAMVGAITAEAEIEGDTDTVRAMRDEATKLCLRWGWVSWPGLPGTYPTESAAP